MDRHVKYAVFLNYVLSRGGFQRLFLSSFRWMMNRNRRKIGKDQQHRLSTGSTSSTLLSVTMWQ